MYFADALTLDAPRRNGDGYVAVHAHAARTGAYQYSGRDVDPDNKHGLRDQAVVHVARDEADVFDTASLASFVGKPITDDHPTESVTSQNWRQHARGVIMGAAKDGQRVGFDLAFFDAPTIAKLDAGKAELSNGYSCDLQFGDFTASDGTKCQAKQTNIRGNHTALVDRGRAGPEYRVNMAHCDAAPSSFLDALTTQEKPVKTMLIDGLTVDIANADTAEATIKTLLVARDKALGDVATLTTDKATLSAEKTTLEQQVKDAKMTPQQLRDASKAYTATVDKAKALGVTVTDSMDEPAIKQAVVNAKLGDAAKGWTDVQIAASFATLAKDDAVVTDTLRTALTGQPMIANDTRTVRDLARASRY